MGKKELVNQYHVEVSSLIENDIEELERILRQHVRNSDTREIIESEISDIKGYMRGNTDDYHRKRKYLVARTSDGRPIGCMAYSSPDQDMIVHFFDISDKDSVELLNAFVDDEIFRGGGVGKKLFEEVCNSAKLDGKKDLLIHSGPRYEMSWPFYDKMCDESRGFISDKYGPGKDAKTWLKHL